MYYDIIQKESVDEFGNTIIELEAQTTPPIYDDITPKDMSLENQLKAGVKIEKVTGKSRPSLESSDLAEQSIYQNGSVLDSSVFDQIPEPSSDPNPQSTESDSKSTES